MISISQLFKGVIKKTKGTFDNPYKKIGLNWMQVRALKNPKNTLIKETPFLNGRISYKNQPEFFHGIEEIFLNEIYQTNFGEVQAPYIIDCGANIGLSVIYFKTTYPKAQILAFEPDAFNFELLSKNVASMKLTGVTLKDQAVWIKADTLQFVSEGSVSSQLQSLNNSVSTNTTMVTAVRLKELLTEKVHLLKLDIEGAEYEVMKDIEDKLYLIDNIFLEYHGTFKENEKLEELLRIVRKNKFAYYIKEASTVYINPFNRVTNSSQYDVQLNIFCFRL